MKILLIFGALALAIGLVIEQSLRIQDDSILQMQIDELRKRMEELENEKRGRTNGSLN